MCDKLISASVSNIQLGATRSSGNSRNGKLKFSSGPQCKNPGVIPNSGFNSLILDGFEEQQSVILKYYSTQKISKVDAFSNYLKSQREEEEEKNWQNIGR